MQVPSPSVPNFDKRASAAMAATLARVPQTGSAVITFGAFPGASDASVDVVDQKGITLDAIVHAEIALIATADHSADEHFVEPLAFRAGNIRPGVGFTIYGLYTGLGDTRAFGQWTVAWSWS